MKFKIYDSKIEYIIKLDEINKQLNFPSKNYSKILNGKRIHFIADKIMTRTWADENPRLTEQNKYAFPVDEDMEKNFIGLEDYDSNWYLVEEIIIKSK